MPADDLLGYRTEGMGGLADAAESFLDAANYGRYGMSERDRSQLIGRIPGSPGYGAEGERYTSSYLFARRNPGLAHLIGPFANAVSDTMYGTDYADTARRGREAGAAQRQSEMTGGPSLQEVIGRQQRERNAAASPPEDTSRVDVSVGNVYIPESATRGPAIPMAPPIARPEVGAQPTGLPSTNIDDYDLGDDVGFSFPDTSLYPDDPTFGSVTVTQEEMDLAEANQARVNAGLPPLRPGQETTPSPTAREQYEEDVDQTERENADTFLQGGGPGSTTASTTVGNNSGRNAERQALQDEYGEGVGDLLFRMGLGGGGTVFDDVWWY